jgi:transposase
MHPNDTHDKFIELRAQGLSLRTIAARLGVHRNTLIKWDDEHAIDILRLHSDETEAIRERLLPAYDQQLADVIEEYNRVTAELRARECKQMPTSWLARRQFELLERIDQMRNPPSRTLLKSNPPPDPTTPDSPNTPAEAV